MFDGFMSPLHWLVVLIVLLVVMGPKEGVQAARTFGRTLEQVRRLGREPIDELLSRVSATEPADEETPPQSKEGRDDPSDRRDPRT
jgi:Sec-independent protein translocase protein TatA